MNARARARRRRPAETGVEVRVGVGTSPRRLKVRYWSEQRGPSARTLRFLRLPSGPHIPTSPSSSPPNPPQMAAKKRSSASGPSSPKCSTAAQPSTAARNVPVQVFRPPKQLTFFKRSWIWYESSFAISMLEPVSPGLSFPRDPAGAHPPRSRQWEKILLRTRSSEALLTWSGSFD